MKYIRLSHLFLLLFAMASLLASCSKWLDVSPKTTVKEADQFSSVQGFYDALFGVYQKASEQSLYGAELSYSLLDVLAQRYESKADINARFGKIARYDYNGDDLARNAISTAWSSMYAAIAQCNYILQNTENGVLSATDKGIVKGEALGMRAYLHFDLLRLFAPAYLDGANAQEPAIPYLEQFHVTPTQRLSVEAILEKCEKDLKEAESLQSVARQIDQIAGNQNSTSRDLNLIYRQNHLNYWAVKATLARLYLYKGNKTLAGQYAKDVIDSKLFQFINPSSLIVDPTSGSADMTFTPEHVFSVYTTGLKQRAEEVFKASTLTAPDPSDLFSTRPKLNALYETGLAGYGTDIRGPNAVKSLWNQLMPAVVYTRKYYNENQDNVRNSLIPLVRLPEMYYIAAESGEDLHDAVGWLNTVRTNRLIPALPDPASAAALEAEIEKEYRKEFYGEGQLWFYYKRKNKQLIPDGTGILMTPSLYVFPYPMVELDYGK